MVPTLPDVRAVLLVIAGAVISVLAFPPFGPGWLVVIGVTLFLTGLRLAEDRGKGLALGAIYGLTFFGGLLWWISGLGVTRISSRSANESPRPNTCSRKWRVTISEEAT